MPDYLTRRGAHYHYFRRVPKKMREYDPRIHIRVSLETTSEKEARVRAGLYNDYIEEYWRGLINSGEKVDGEAAYKAAIALAKLRGFSYKPMGQLLAGPVNDLVQRLEEVARAPEDKLLVGAVMGTVPAPQIMLGNVAAKYWPLCIDRNLNKSDFQVRKWQNPRQRAIDDFITVVGDKNLSDLARKDVLDFRSWLRDQISEGMAPDTANKKMRQVKDMIRVVANDQEIALDIHALFREVRFMPADKSRPPFEASFVQDKLLPSIGTLNDDARFFIFMMADTGARGCEIVGLREEDIILDAEIPHIWIREREKAALKTKQSHRKIPLVGSALLAAQHFPKGTDRYAHADSISALVNKYLTVNNLRPSPAHTIYSLRHTFKDRLRDVEAPEELIDNLMGHKTDGPYYGRGHRLETMHKYLKQIEFVPPRF